MPQTTPALKPLSAHALTPKAPASTAGLHPASQHSLSARPAPLAAASSENPVQLVPHSLAAETSSVLQTASSVPEASEPEEEATAPASSAADELPKDPQPLSIGDVWAEMISSFAEETPAPAVSVKKKQKKHDESNDFMQNLPTPVPVSLFEEAPESKTFPWRWVFLGGALVAAAALGVLVYLQFCR